MCTGGGRCESRQRTMCCGAVASAPPLCSAWPTCGNDTLRCSKKRTAKPGPFAALFAAVWAYCMQRLPGCVRQPPFCATDAPSTPTRTGRPCESRLKSVSVAAGGAIRVTARRCVARSSMPVTLCPTGAQFVGSCSGGAPRVVAR
eukprot:scaffold28876_cov72-Phaeocystis_antarctica.AAC.5